MKHLEHKLPKYLSQQLQANFEIHDHDTRQSQDIHNFSITSEFERQCFNTKISSVWNKIPQNIKNHNLKLLSHKFRQHMVLKYNVKCYKKNCPSC